MTDETNNMGAKDSERLPSYFLKITKQKFEMAECKEVFLGGCDWEHRTDSSEIKMKNPGILSDYRDMSNQ